MMIVDLLVQLQNGKKITPTVLVPKEVAFTIPNNTDVYVSGYVRGLDSYDVNRKHTFHDQQFVAQRIHAAREDRRFSRNRQFFDVKVIGKLIRMIDSGRGWKKVVLETEIEDHRGKLVSKVSIGYFGPDRHLIPVSELHMGNIYEIIVEATTPERTVKRKDGTERTLRFNNLTALYAREIVQPQDKTEAPAEEKAEAVNE